MRTVSLMSSLPLSPMALRLVLVSVLSIGCSKGSDGAGSAANSGEYDCEREVNRTIECIPELAATSREKLVERCNTEVASADSRIKQARLAKAPCIEKQSCAEFTSCVLAVADAERKVSQTERASHKLTELRKAIVEARWGEAAAICRVYPDAAADSPTFGAACADVAKGSTNALTKELVAVRDARADTDTVVRCVELREMARRLSDEVANKADILCNELASLHLVREASAAVERARALGAGSGEATVKGVPAPIQVPLQCQWALESLAKIDSEWARATATELTKSCNDELPRELVAALTRALTAMRDGTDETPKDRYRELGFSRCFDLRRLTSTLGPAAEAGAKALCDEVDLAGDVREALSEAEQATQAAEDLPFRCDYTIDQLAKLTDSAWAKERARALANTCYIGVGKRVLAKRVPGMKHVCDYQVQKVVNGLRRFALSDSSVDELAKQAEPLCPPPEATP